MERYIAILKTYSDLLQFLHWNTAKDYAAHLLFERLMGDIPDLLDRFVEVSMGNRGITQVDFTKFKNEKVEAGVDLRKFIENAKSEFNVLLVSANETEQNVIVDILEMFDRHLYLL